VGTIDASEVGHKDVRGSLNRVHRHNASSPGDEKEKAGREGTKHMSGPGSISLLRKVNTRLPVAKQQNNGQNGNAKSDFSPIRPPSPILSQGVVFYEDPGNQEISQGLVVKHSAVAIAISWLPGLLI
jgi:hypothetical protein